MKPVSNGRRPRGRPNRKQQHSGPSRPNNFDSSGPEGRVRGNAHQVYERYLAMARDAVSASDRVAAETYYQYAEHYFRVLNSSTDPQQNGQARQDRGSEDNRRDDNRRDGGRQDRAPHENTRHEGARQEGGQQTGGARNGQQPVTPVTPVAPAANGQEASPQPAPPKPAPPKPARSENRGGRQPRRTAPAAPVAENVTGNGAAPQSDNGASDNADAQPKANGGDCEPVSV